MSEAPRSALGELVAELDRRAAARREAPTANANANADADADVADVGELPTLKFLRRTWARLDAERRLSQSRARLPSQAGPLNSHQLVHRALTLMHAVSPEYLGHFMAQVDALSWLERVNGASAAPARVSRSARGS